MTVVVELMARFDEEASIDTASRLREAGVQVVYGVVGYKTHAKMLLIVRAANMASPNAMYCRHRQLPSAYGAPLYRLRPADLQREHRRRRRTRSSSS